MGSQRQRGGSSIEVVVGYRVDGGGPGGSRSRLCASIFGCDPDAAEDYQLGGCGGRGLRWLDWPPCVQPVFL